jgi:hypothetical protein
MDGSLDGISPEGTEYAMSVGHLIRRDTNG